MLEHSAGNPNPAFNPSIIEQNNEQDGPATPLSGRGARWWLIGLGSVYAGLVVSHWSKGYIDFGDGNYLYISWRLGEGAMLYRDILAPQPPLHLMTGALIAKLAGAVGAPMVYAFRLFGVLIHLATMLAVYFATVRVAATGAAEKRSRCRGAGVAAAAVYMFLPLGFWWSLGYQSEPLEMFFFMLSFAALLRWNAKSVALAGALAALTPLTNMTAAPYVLFTIGFLAVRKPRLALPYAIPCVLIILAVTATMEWRTGAYLENVILNQVGSFPRKEFLPPGENLLTYAYGKIVREGSDVLRLEGGFVLLALLGILRFARRGPACSREFASWYGFFALCSILYVSKGGTMDYIFTIGEPFVAVFCGYLLFHFHRKHTAGLFHGFTWRDSAPLAGLAAGMALAVAFLAPGVAHSWATLKQRTYELDAHTTMQVVDQIRRNTPPDGLILAPPYYAFLAQRRIAEDYSELFLWTLKYLNELQDGQRGRGVQTVERIANLLREKKIAFIVLDLDQTGKIPEIRQAIDENYEPKRLQELRTLNTRLMFYAPK